MLQQCFNPIRLVKALTEKKEIGLSTVAGLPKPVDRPTDGRYPC